MLGCFFVVCLLTLSATTCYVFERGQPFVRNAAGEDPVLYSLVELTLVCYHRQQQQQRPTRTEEVAGTYGRARPPVGTLDTTPYRV